MSEESDREAMRVLQQFFSTGTQYYVSGRYAVIAGQAPVAGNLLHHAVEMFLKGGLAKSTTLAQLKGLSHNLPNLWGTFKTTFNAPTLSTFDPLVTSLHEFEELRYPDSILAKGMAVTMGVTRPPAAPGVAPARPEPSYELYLDEVDALVGRVFKVASVNPAAFFGGLPARAREYLREGNAQAWAG
jgi:hypothetical protein